MRILGIDPSGNFEEGKGTTGFCLLTPEGVQKVWTVNAGSYENKADYWIDVCNHITLNSPDYVVCESYQLYHFKGQRAENQAFSFLETPQLIGAITITCRKNNIPLYFQSASQVKSRWADNILEAKGIIEKKGHFYYVNGQKLNAHMKDAIRHAIHFFRYTSKRVTS